MRVVGDVRGLDRVLNVASQPTGRSPSSSQTAIRTRDLSRPLRSTVVIVAYTMWPRMSATSPRSGPKGVTHRIVGAVTGPAPRVSR